MMSDKTQKLRFLERFLPEARGRRLVLLTGARQTGKTTSAKRKYPDLAYVNLDSPEERETVRTTPAASWGKTVGNAVLDEAQKEPIVFDKVKYAFDGKAISFSLLLGSSQILLLKKIQESLAGRISVYELWPLMLGELRHKGAGALNTPLVDRLVCEGAVGDILADCPERLLEKEDAPLREAEDYLLQWGGMPALLPLTDAERWKWLKDYEYTYLERDLADLARLDDLMPFRTFQRLSALRSAQLLNYSELARDAQLSVDTARRYLEYLQLSYQTILLKPYFKNLTSAVVKTPKLYWLDVGLLRRLSGMREGIAGSIYESYVVGELYKWLKTAQRDVEPYFYRTRSGLELDLLLQTGGGTIGMEIKARVEVYPSDITAMRQVSAKLKKEWKGGLVIYRGKAIIKITEPSIWAVPSRRLFT
jgi:hypothetical protein